MEKKQFVSDLEGKNPVESVFLIKYIAANKARDGRHYLNVILCDKSGDIEGRKWSDAQRYADEFKAGDYVHIKGKTNIFQNRLQVIIDGMTSVALDDINSGDFERSSSNSSEEMFNQLLEIIEGLEDIYLRELLKKILFDHDIKERLMIWPAGKTIHHAYKGGLLEHILSCTQLSVHLSAHYHVNKSYVVAGAVLHDLCKIYEITKGPVVEYTDEGKLIGHLVKALEIVDHFSSQMDQFPYSVKMHLKHILLSHHGVLEYGSPKVPMTKEAYLVHLIDYMDSKMNALAEVFKTDNLQGRWSNVVRHLDRSVYKEDLPHFTSMKEREKASPKKKDIGKEQSTELKHSMGDLLKGLKID